ncbi:MAG: lactate racemase domain-containing protein, partial [Jiangellaceae bacterium]
MSRPGFVLQVDERTPPLLVHQGEGFRLERLPLGSSVVYPPDSLPAVRNVDAAIAQALREPVGLEPLSELLHAGMRLTIVFDDISLPLPPMQTPDIRQRVIEQVLELAASKGVDDVELIAANSLHRRMTPAELRRIVGDRVFRSFFPDHLRNHDAEDTANLVEVGSTAQGELVELNRRAMESDLVVYVNITLTAMSGGPKSVSVGLASYRSLRHHHNVHTLRHSRSFNDPPNSAMHHSYERMRGVIDDHVTVFQIEAT